MTFIVDTGSTWSWLTSEDCENCPGNHYQYHLSSDYKTYHEVENIQYMVGHAKGYIVEDSIALTPSLSSAARDFKFISIFDSDLTSLKSDGLLGMGPATRTGESGTQM